MTVDESVPVRREYDLVIAKLFRKLIERYGDALRLPFTKADVEAAIVDLELAIKNVPDVIYTYRVGRAPLPDEILTHGHWAIEARGKGKYTFVRLARSPYVDIPADIEIISLLDATPQIVLKYQGSDEQAILARIRYNRLVDVFTSLTAYHIQSHFRTALQEMGQIEIDDLYIGVDTDGRGFILPVEAKGAHPAEQLGVIQITQMVRFAQERFPDLSVRPIGIKVMPDSSYVFVEFKPTLNPNDVVTRRYKRYALYREQ